MGSGLRTDPAVERWYKMRETTHLYFRPTPKSIAFGLVTLVLVPVALWKIIDEGNVFDLFGYRYGLCFIESDERNV